ncbi:hypothetical protein D3C78_1447430 [compost metagenome]
MIDIIEKLPFRDDVAFSFTQAELLGYGILYTNHRKIIMAANGGEPILQVPVIHKHTEQKDYGWLMIGGKYF